ncbi:MAG: helicase-exonuclease AddAB subunit AddA [Oscillospiraceae bacterium]|jgi:ATP-dependent helicase/nuclease subunit A|nr:helicase-exonuclease AddAB subunit AddA [Oscillospiraceae bacterium]
MAVQLTKSQQAVVNDTGGRVLVSAAAGSGKTRVLVDRLFRRVLGEEQASMDDFLIITYTRASAAELRERIAHELSQRMTQSPGDRHLQRQLLLIYQADIKTIDSFCTALLRENVHLLDLGEGQGLSSDFRVLDESEAELLRRRVLPRVLEAFYTDMTPGQVQLADCFGFGRDDRGLEELTLDLYGKVQSHAYPDRWLEEQRAAWASLPEDIGETEYGQVLLSGLGRKVRHWASVLRSSVSEMAGDGALHKAYSGCFLQAAASLDAFAEGTEAGWDEAAARRAAFPRLTAARKCESPELKDKMKNVWSCCKKEVTAAWTILEIGGRDAGEDLRRSAPAMEALLDLCMEFGRAYQKEKLRRNATDFSDQEHYAIRLLLGEDGRPTPLAAVTAGRYREVMVDEYQDTNQVQNCIFDAVSRNGQNLFTVGDVKQSIYRFRLADPTIFLEKYRLYPDVELAGDGKPRRILLSQNFRSRQPVLDAVNFVFEAVMSREMGEIDYGEAERLNFGADYLPPREDCQAEFHLLETPRNQRGAAVRVSSALLEARFAAARIAGLLREGYPVTGEDGSLRPCTPEDIVILMRSPGPRLRHYARALAEQNIPCAIQEDEDFFSAMEVAVVCALLQILDNPRQDVPLITVLRSPLMGFSPDRLAVIRGEHPSGDFYEALEASGEPECEAFLRQLDELRSLARDMSMHRLIWRLYNQLNVLGVFGAMSNGKRRRENLIALYEHARAFETAGYKGLFAFVSHLRRLLESGEQPVTATGDAAGVRIMSIHRSKGLEFPIVILADLNKTFNKADLQTPVLVHPKLGLGPMYIDLDRRIRYATAARDAVSGIMSREMRSEEMRVLYVGMTRAKEKLIMTASMSGAAGKLKTLSALSALPVPPETVDSARSMAEWILLPLLRRHEAGELRALAGQETGSWALREDTPWIVEYHDGASYSEAPVRTPETDGGAVPSVEALPVDREALDFVYPYPSACTAPTKLTATQLKGREKDREIAEETVQPYARQTFAAPRFLMGQRPLDGAERGTAIHLVMQHVPLQEKVDIEAVVEDLVERRLLTQEQADAVPQGVIRRFLASPLAEELRQAEELQREYRFSFLVSGGEYFPGLDGEEVMLQGVVDLFAVKDGAVTVVDFKTDYVTAATLPEKLALYCPQLTAYSTALEKILGLPVRKKVLYFFSAGQAAEV